MQTTTTTTMAPQGPQSLAANPLRYLPDSNVKLAFSFTDLKAYNFQLASDRSAEKFTPRDWAIGICSQDPFHAAHAGDAADAGDAHTTRRWVAPPTQDKPVKQPTAAAASVGFSNLESRMTTMTWDLHSVMSPVPGCERTRQDYVNKLPFKWLATAPATPPLPPLPPPSPPSPSPPTSPS
ncbi:hypothetical protein ACLKA6_011290 [Drosophila palustris]